MLRIDPTDTEYERAARSAYAREQLKKKEREAFRRDLAGIVIIALCVLVYVLCGLAAGVWE